GMAHAVETRSEAQKPVPGSDDRTTILAVSGMSCGNCVRHVTQSIQSIPGVQNVVVSLEAQQARIRWAEGKESNVAAAVKAVEGEGFGAKVVEASADHGHRTLAGWQLNLWIGLTGTIVLMAGEWLFRWGQEPWFRWLSFFVASVVQVFAGAPFYRGAWTQL